MTHLTRLLDDDATAAERAHLEACAACRVEQARLQQIARAFPNAVPAGDITNEVMTRIERKPTRWLIPALALAAAFALYVRKDEFQARGGLRERLDVRVGERVLREGDHVSRNSAFAFAAHSDKAFVAIYAVDSAGEMHWFYPAYTDAATNPTSVPTRTPLTDAVVPDALPAGPLQVIALFTDQPRSVKDVEAQRPAGITLRLTVDP